MRIERSRLGVGQDDMRVHGRSLCSLTEQRTARFQHQVQSHDR
jgi:hypothetical protein